jgi:glutamate receptor, ionotropic, plant
MKVLFSIITSPFKKQTRLNKRASKSYSFICLLAGKILNRCSKVVLVMWLCMIFIVVQIFTATLSSWLTLDQLRPRLPTSYENAGYQRGSFIRDLLIQRYNCSGERLTALNSYEDIRNALSNGSVNAVFDELPYIDIFLSKYGSEYMKFGPMNQESGMAFVSLFYSHILTP